MKNQLIIWSFFVFTACASGQRIPQGASLPKSTLSPNRHYGVLVPIANLRPNSKAEVDTDSLFDLKTGRVLVELQGETGYSHPLNWLEVAPTRWSSDGSLLLWEVESKWCPVALDLVKISEGKVEWQTDLLRAVQQVVLARTKRAAPRKYAAAKRANAEQADGYHGEQTDYPEGFTIDMHVTGPIAFPVHVEAVLTSDPKSYPEEGHILNSYLEGTIDAQGKFAVTSFHLGHRTWDRF